MFSALFFSIRGICNLKKSIQSNPVLNQGGFPERDGGGAVGAEKEEQENISHF